MSRLLELAGEIVSAHASTTSMTKEELLSELTEVHSKLKALESGEETEAAPSDEPVVSMRKAFGRKHVTCMICGEKMKTLARHLSTKHDMKPREYRKKFGIPSSQSLAASDYSETRRQMAIDRGLGEKLAKARAERKKQ